VQPTVDSFRALARSSPWRWRTLHFTRRGGLGDVEAWVRRPGQLLVRPADGSLHYVSGVPYSVSPLLSTGGPVADAPPPEEEPVFGPDGLVERRPDDWYLEHGDPMWENYTWTAMLDPDELSHHVDIERVREDELGGRAVWWARLVPVEGYEPRCGCCPLLWSEVAAAVEYAGDADRLERFAAEGYPEAHDVALDLETGVVAALQPIGGGAEHAFALEIHEVDADLDAVFAGRG
jgi:hypothetical protein